MITGQDLSTTCVSLLEVHNACKNLKVLPATLDSTTAETAILRATFLCQFISQILNNPSTPKEVTQILTLILNMVEQAEAKVCP